MGIKKKKGGGGWEGCTYYISVNMWSFMMVLSLPHMGLINEWKLRKREEDGGEDPKRD